LPRHIARWDLDKTYLRTEFDTIRDIVRTALESPDEKRTNPGASTLLREMVHAGVSVHILSGSPEQMRRRLEDMLRLRFRAVKDQLGFKLPALLHARLNATPPSPGDAGIRHETLFGDDAEADAFVYSLYADTLAGRVDVDLLVAVCDRGRVYPDVIESIVDCARQVERVEAVERILIHLERQTPPDDFRVYGARTVPFYNYLQAALIVHEDGRVPGETVLRVGVDLVVHHRFDGDALARSYLDLVRRGHLHGTGVEELLEAFQAWTQQGKVPGYVELKILVERLPALAALAKDRFRGKELGVPDYMKLVAGHTARRSRGSR
jgi:hypothetical protein